MAVTVEAEPDGDGLVQAFDAHRQNIETPERARGHGLCCRLSGARPDFRYLAEPMKHVDRAVYTEELGGQMRQ